MMEASMPISHSNKPSFIVQTLGHFDVHREGRSLVMSSPGSKKIWELYKFMLTHRDRNFTPESLLDHLWVSEEYSDPRGTLRRQMHRLRQTLAEDEDKGTEKTLIFSNGYYHWNQKIDVQVDTDLFEDYIRWGDLSKSEDPVKALCLYRQSLDLYHGDYLPDCADQHWVFPVRNHYRRLYSSTVLKAIELLKVRGEYDDVLPMCRKAIQIDIYEEVFHLSLMEALLVQGERKQALEHYEHITAFYYREMGIKPSVAMRELYKKLLKTKETIDSGHNLYDELESGVTLENAFYCDPEVFRSIYELERRRSQRSGVSFSIGVLTLQPMKGYTFSQEELRMKQLKEDLMERLRKGDTFTQWNGQQLVVLLPGVDATLTEKVLTRVLGFEGKIGEASISQITHLTSEPQMSHEILREVGK